MGMVKCCIQTKIFEIFLINSYSYNWILNFIFTYILSFTLKNNSTYSIISYPPYLKNPPCFKCTLTHGNTYNSTVIIKTNLNRKYLRGDKINSHAVRRKKYIRLLFHSHFKCILMNLCISFPHSLSNWDRMYMFFILCNLHNLKFDNTTDIEYVNVHTVFLSKNLLIHRSISDFVYHHWKICLEKGLNFL